MKQDHDERMTELEVKLAFQDELLDALNSTVARQQQELELVQQQLRLLYQQLRQNTAAKSGGEFNLRDELPPHY
ncbi:SlyX family protein [Neisseriaceae bacterium TC5R-5]|nr:SlyX family protein [Neisseriaceae bacterium TC5R-5]